MRGAKLGQAQLSGAFLAKLTNGMAATVLLPLNAVVAGTHRGPSPRRDTRREERRVVSHFVAYNAAGFSLRF